MKLRDLIRAVRACKTAAEERAVISKECALIRTAIKEEDEKFRHRNVAKLMYIHMLGYPTHFGQMECLKLISAATFPEKRIGYLALTLLLNEQAEVLTLVTNSLKLDLTNPSQYIQGLALITIGNLATQDMARDLASDIDKLLRSTNSYLRKKAALAAIRLLKKEPDLIEHMADRIVALLKDRAHGVLITGIQLMIDVLDLLPDMKVEYTKLVPSLVRLLRNFISMGFSPEHDVAGIADPFMQFKLLRILRILGKGNEEASEQMNDVLAQVATNTESAKNAGNAILYECVQTIMDVQSDASLRVLAVNILGRFLLNRDNNIRYVALNSLSKVVSEDISAVQRHRNTIVECLKDSDVSIRQRALELIFQLVNEQNVIALTTELLNYLVVTQADQKANLASKIMQIVEKYSPSKKWRVDTIITMLTVAGNQADESVIRTAILFLAQADGLQGYATHRLYHSMLEDTSQVGMLHVGIWCVGEFGDLLIRNSPSIDDDNSTAYGAIAEVDVLTLLDKCMRVHNADNSTKSLLLNSLVKLSVRFSNGASRATIKDLLAPFRTSMSLELQQRSVEYTKLLTGQWDGIRADLLGKMPVIDENSIKKRRGGGGGYGEDSPLPGSSSNGEFAAPPPAAAFSGLSNTSSSLALPVSSNGGGGGSLIDLDDIFGGSASPVKYTSSAQHAPSHSQSTTSNDLLSDIFSLGANISHPTPPPNNAAAAAANVMSMFAPPPAAINPFGANVNNIPHSQHQPSTSSMDDIFGLSSSASPSAVVPVAMISASPTIKAFDKNGLQIILELSKPNPATPNLTRLFCKFSNATLSPMDNLIFQAAVPKYLKLEMLPPSSTTIPSQTSGVVTQEIKVVNTLHGEKNIMLKLKLGYTSNGTTVDELVQVSSFPALY